MQKKMCKLTLSDGAHVPYTSGAKVKFIPSIKRTIRQMCVQIVLVGMGADEQLAGYSRHRTAFDRHGWPGLIDEVHCVTLNAM